MRSEKSDHQDAIYVLNQGNQPKIVVALLHSFWWQEGERMFREVLERDSKCAIATWGIATILIGNPFGAGPTPAQTQQAKEAITRGREIGAKTERERLFIEAVAQYYEGQTDLSHGARLKALSDAFEKLAARFSADDEAQIFSALYYFSRLVDMAGSGELRPEMEAARRYVATD